VGAQLFHSKLTDAFHNFTNAPKKVFQLYYANGKLSQFISMYKSTRLGSWWCCTPITCL